MFLTQKKRLFLVAIPMLICAIMMFGMLPTAASALDEETATALLQELQAVVTQNGKTLDENTQANPIDMIKVTISFKVPVKGDWTIRDEEAPKGSYISKDDTVSFQVAQGLLMEPPNATYTLKQGNVKVGTLYLTTDTDAKTIKAKVVFDGQDRVFNGEASGYEDPWNDVRCSFSCNLKYAGPVDPDDWGEQDVQILYKTYTVDVPEPETVIDGKKSGVRDGQYIDWTVRVTPTKGTKPGMLDGYTFLDDIDRVGTYEAGTFKIGASSDGTGATAVTPDSAQLAKDILSYTFPAGTDGERYVFFRTKISDGDFFGSGDKMVSNTAKILKNNTVVAKMQGAVTYNIEWISKTAASVNNATGEITWTITANQMGAALQNAVITDLLDAKMSLVSASYQVWNATNGAWSTAIPFNPAPSDGQYALGNITAKVMLTLKGKIKDGYDIRHTVQTIKNTASLSWNGHAGIGSNTVVSNIGVNPVSKSAGAYDSAAHDIPWTVNVQATDVNDSLKIYDLLVYGTQGSFDASENEYDISGTSEDNNANLQSILEELTPCYNQRYADDSFSSSSSLALTCYPIIDTGAGGNRIADLLVITESDLNGFSVTSDKPKSFSFHSVVTDPAIYLKNSNTTIYNTASLYSSDAWVNQASANRVAISYMLNKDVMDRVSAGKDLTNAANANAAAGNANNSFDYKDKSVVFRFHVDANGISNVEDGPTGIYGETLGSLIVSDKLPDGWEFDDIANSQRYLIYKATANGSRNVTANGSPLSPTDTADFLTVAFSNNTSVKFTFAKMEGPYLILVRAHPTDETLNEFFSQNGTNTILNTADLIGENAAVYASDSQESKISNTVLSKTYSKVENGVLRWTLEYKPCEIKYPNATIVDTLDDGLEPRLNADGSLRLDSIQVIKLTLNANGSYSDAGSVAPVLGKNVIYNNAARELTFLIEDTAQAYRFQYITDVTAESGVKLTNSVKLTDGSQGSAQATQIYTVSDSDVSATMKRSGWIEINKKDNLNNRLSDVEFTIYAADKTSALRNGITKADGKLVIRGLPVGSYWIRETGAPVGFTADAAMHSLLIAQEGETLQAVIDGTVGNSIAVVNVKDGTLGNLSVTKTVSGDGASPAKDFAFTVTLSDSTINGDYGDMTFKDGVATFALKHGEHKTATGLLRGISYTVTEADYTLSGYMTEKSGATGTIAADNTQTAPFINTRNAISKLTVIKRLAGNAADPDKEFTFTVKLSENINGVYGGVTFTNGEASFPLRGGEIKTIDGLPNVVDYTVTESNNEGYLVTKSGDAGTISEAAEAVATFVNTRDTYGDLTVTKAVGGNSGSADKEFSFTVDLDDQTINGSYGGMTFNRGVATFALKHGEQKTAVGLPNGTTYTVTEAECADDGYTTEKAGDTGTIAGENTQTAAFTNTRDVFSSLLLSKVVVGGAFDPSEEFDFTLALTDAQSQPLNQTFDYSGSKSGTIRNGDTISLKNSDTVEIKGLPAGAKYSITESGNVRYKVSVNDADASTISGVVGEENAEITFINTLVTTDFNVTKSWQGGNGGIISLTLYADGKKLDPQPPYTHDGDVYSYSRLPMYNNNGSKIVYAAKERYMDGYMTIYDNVSPYESESNYIYDGGTIINRAVTSIAVRKVWTGLNEDEKHPDIALTLYCDGVAVNKKHSLDKNGWYHFYNLPISSSPYYVEETPVDGYAVSYENLGVYANETECVYNGGTITNHKIPKTGDTQPLGLYCLLLAVSLLCMAGICLSRFMVKRRTK